MVVNFADKEIWIQAEQTDILRLYLYPIVLFHCQEFHQSVHAAVDSPSNMLI